MDEQYLQDLLSAYLDNELTPEQKAAVEQHLAASPEAREQLARLERLNRLIDAQSGLDGEEYWEKSAARIEARLGSVDTQVTSLRSERRRRSGLWWKIGSVAASVAILVFIGLHQTDILRHEPSGMKDAPAPSSAEPSAVNTVGTEAPHSEETAARPTPAPVPSPQRAAEEQKDKSVVAESGRMTGDDARKREDRVATAEAPKGLASPVGGQQAALSENYATASEVAQAVAAAPPVRRQVAAQPAQLSESVRADSEAELPTVEDRGQGLALTSMPSEKPAEKGDAEEKSADERERQLTHWRQVRDSLTERLAAVRKTDTRLSKALPEVRPQSLASRAAAQAKDSSAEIEGRLIDAWRMVIAWTNDSAERNRGLEYLRRVAADSTSPVRNKAADYLEQVQSDKARSFE